jgi:TRAP-type C4-dicarboxylate transport system permease small subunit
MSARSEDTIEKALAIIAALLMLAGGIWLIYSLWIYPSMWNSATAPVVHIRDLSESLQTRAPGIIVMVLAIFPLLAAVVHHFRD